MLFPAATVLEKPQIQPVPLAAGCCGLPSTHPPHQHRKATTTEAKPYSQQQPRLERNTPRVPRYTHHPKEMVFKLTGGWTQG